MQENGFENDLMLFQGRYAHSLYEDLAAEGVRFTLRARNSDDQMILGIRS